MAKIRVLVFTMALLLFVAALATWGRSYWVQLNYPNAFDLKHAKAEGRTEPGTNIFIHGKSSSVGCLAMGDNAIEELFVLAYDVGRRNVGVVIAPSDPRLAPLQSNGQVDWVDTLYAELTGKFLRYTID